jgi:hypothetical protein
LHGDGDAVSASTHALLFALAAPGPGAAPGPKHTAEVGVVERKEVDPTVFPDPRKFSRGFFVEGETGALVPMGKGSKVLGPGFALGVRLGYEIRRWLALQLHAVGSVSRYDDGLLVREHLQQYYYTGELRLGIPIRRFVIFAQGGAGMFQLSSNLLQLAGIAADNQRIGLLWDAGLGLDFHSLDRHFSGGLLGTFYGMPALDTAGAIAAQVYVRYTL